MISRRTLTMTAFAASAIPAFAQGSQPFSPAFDRARGLDQLHSLTIALDGEIIAAEAFRGPSQGTAVNVKSVSKTLVAALTGAAIDRAELPGTEATLGAVAPRLIPQDADPRVREITVADLLTMQAGLERTSGGNYGAWVSSGNWVSDALSRPIVAEPGSRMLYSTGSYHVLGAVLSETTGESLLTMARRWLGEPLGIDIPPWTRDPQGRYMGGNNMAMTPEGMIRFGEVYRNKGMWKGERVLSESWVEASLTPRTRSVFSGDQYGYGWFLRNVRGHDFAYARGYGGQMIFVSPSLRLTVAITSDPNRPARSDGHVGDLNDLLAETIVPEAERRA